MSEVKYHTIGIPIDKVGERLRTLHESLLENGMALKAETGVHINCSRSEVALGFTLEVVVFDTEDKEEKENG